MDTSQTSNLLMLVKPTELPCLVNLLSFCQNYTHDIKQLIEDQFNHFVYTLKKHHINIKVFEAPPKAPASTFPNNWVSSHVNHKTHEKTIVIYPMQNQLRRLERESPLMDYIYDDPTATQIVDLTFYETLHMFLESTGSFVLDRINKVAYCGLSGKTNFNVAVEWGKIMGYQIIGFETFNPYRNNKPVYHTNIMMTIAEQYAIICLDSIISKDDQQRVLSQLKKSGRQIITITLEQMNNFCGNCLQVRNQSNQFVLCLSQKAYESFTPSQLTLLKSFCNGGFVIAEYSLIELFGNGSIRCSLLEYGF